VGGAINSDTLGNVFEERGRGRGRDRVKSQESETETEIETETDAETYYVNITRDVLN
jgi:hypothetical protein